MKDRRTMKVMALILGVLVLAGITFAMFGTPHTTEVVEQEEEPQAAFNPYAPTEPDPVAPPEVRQNGELLEEEPEGVPEGFEEPEGGGGVVVLEEIQAPQEQVMELQAIPGIQKAEREDLSTLMRQRYGTKKQQMLLRQMNEDLTSGKLKPFDTSTVMDGRTRRISGEMGRTGIRKNFGPMPTVEEKLGEMGLKRRK